MNAEKFLSSPGNSCQIQQPQVKADDFAEFKGMKPANTVTELRAIELLLAKDDVRSKLIRYIKSIMKLNGKGDGNFFFRDVIRRFMNPEAVQEFSWKGHKTTKSFQNEFPKFIEFVHSIVSE